MSSTHPPDAPHVPSAIGRYQIVRELARGTMGVVYEARDRTLRRTVAVKAIHIAFGVTPAQKDEFEQRFFREAGIGARLRHPGIVAGLDAGKDPSTNTLFIVFEYLKGRTLAEEIDAGRARPWREALTICAKLARALQHAHERGVVHRDMKPANVMVLEGGALDVKIMDFGLAKLETARQQLTALGQSFGSPLYMSPEQALGEIVDARTDVFSLGTIACALILGRPPFAAERVSDILKRVVTGDRPSVVREVAGVPAEVEQVLARAMAIQPDERYPEARLLADDFEDVLAGRRPRLGAASTPENPARPSAAASGSVLVWIAVAALISAVAAVVALLSLLP